MEQQEAFVQRNRYDRFSVTLHWLMAVLLLGQIALGMWMLGLPKDASGLRASWFNVHKSWGMVLGLLIALRHHHIGQRPAQRAHIGFGFEVGRVQNHQMGHGFTPPP